MHFIPIIYMHTETGFYRHFNVCQICVTKQYIRYSTFVIFPKLWYDAWRLIKHRIVIHQTTDHHYDINHLFILLIIIKQALHSSLFVIYKHCSLHHLSSSCNNHNLIINRQQYTNNISSSFNIICIYLYIFRVFVKSAFRLEPTLVISFPPFTKFFNPSGILYSSSLI